MPSPNPRLAQWQQRHQAAMAAVKQAEATRDPQRVRQAYEQLRAIQTAKPDGQAAPPKPKAQRRQGVLSTITNVLQGNQPQ